jgi:hypothetical protein
MRSCTLEAANVRSGDGRRDGRFAGTRVPEQRRGLWLRARGAELIR